MHTSWHVLCRNVLIIQRYFLSKRRLVEEENELENEDDSFSTEDDSFTTQVVADYSASYFTCTSSNKLTIGDSANDLLDNECVTSDSAIVREEEQLLQLRV